MNDPRANQRFQVSRNTLLLAVGIVAVLLWLGIPRGTSIETSWSTEDRFADLDLETPSEKEEETEEEAPARRAILASGQEIVGDFRILTLEEVLRESGVEAAMNVAIEKYPRQLEEMLASTVFDANMRLYRDNGRWEMPIVKAMRQGTEETFAILAASGVDPDLPDSEGQSALHYAAYAGLMGAVEIFLEAGADPSMASYEGATPLRMAAFGGHLDVVEGLLEAGAGPEHSALWAAASSGSDDIVRCLVAAGARLEGSPGDEETMCPMWHASYGGHLSTVRLLLDLGAAPTCPGSIPPSEIARQRDQAEIVALLERRAAR